MENFEITLAINGEQLPVNVNAYVKNEKTYYEIPFENYTLTIYKNTLYTWTADDSNGLSEADIQSIGGQLENA